MTSFICAYIVLPCNYNSKYNSRVPSVSEYWYVPFCPDTRGAAADRKDSCRLCAVEGHISEQGTWCLDTGFRHMFSSPWCPISPTVHRRYGYTVPHCNVWYVKKNILRHSYQCFHVCLYHSF